jgi:fatty acid desaturase
MKYKKVINYLWKHRVQIEFIENNLLETFFFVLVCFLLYKLATKFFKIDNKKKKLFDSFFTIIFFILILSIFITQAIILELNQRKFSQLEYEIRIKNRKIKELKKKLNKWYDWMKNHKN